MSEAAESAVRPECIRERIVKHRTAEVTLSLADHRGRPLAGAKVTIRQVRHRFLFGCNAYMLGRCGDAAAERAYRRRFWALLNYATLPFYWGGYEPRQGDLQAARLRGMAEWCAGQGIRAKGHPLCWHEVVPGWLGEKSPPEVERLQWGRIGREVRTFAGLIDTWDVVNEAVVMPRFKREPNAITRLCRRLGRVGLIRRAFDLARQANPVATLILNDFDTSPGYERLIGACLKAAVPIDVIGIQSHMHRGYWGAERIWEVCQRFSRFGRPLHFTESTLLSGRLKTDDDWKSTRPSWKTTAAAEKRQARQAEEFYRVLFSHPAVEAVTWWDFSDLGAWQGAPAGFVRKDMSPKPAYDALMGLVKGQWWTARLRLTADAAGKVRFRGFLGDYAVQSAAGGAAFSLGKPGCLTRSVQLVPQ